jgi:hypothetical protein
MLSKMLVHGMVAAILIGAAAAVYAEGRGNAVLSFVSAPFAQGVQAVAAGGGHRLDRNQD